MAILNYAPNLNYNNNEVKNYIGLDSTDTNYLKLVFTGDGHIITHGVDYTADYSGGKRGLVPNYNIENYDYGVFTKTGWTELTTDYLPLNDNIVSVNNLWSSEKIVDYIADGIAANDAMVVIGTVDGDGKIQSYNENYLNSDIVNKDFSSLANYSSGWTFRVVNKGGTVAGKTVEIGDMIMCVSDSTTFNDLHWSVIQTNINGTGTLTLNGDEIDFYTNSKVGSNFKIFAPITAGTSGQVLVSSATTDNPNENPVWVNQSSIDSGKLGGTAKEDLLTNVTATDGIITVTVGGTSKQSTAYGNWNINAASANKVNKSLKTSGEGLTTIEYDGSSEQTITLQPATRTTLGGVIVDQNKTNKTISIDEYGNIYLDKDNVINALGFTPETVENTVIVSDKHKGVAPQITKSENTVNESFYFLAYNPQGTSTSDNGIEANWYKLPINSLGNTWRPVKIEGDELFDSANNSDNFINFKKGNLIDIVKDSDNNIVISTSAEINQNAFSVIEIGTDSISASGKTDTVKFTGTNVTISGIPAEKQINFAVADFVGATATTNGSKGLAPAPAAGDQLKFLRGDGTWVVPTNTNTWRKIIVGDNSLSNDITSGDLTITAGENIAVTLTNGTLNIASTYVDHIYSVGTGLNSTSINSGKETKFSLKTATNTEIGGIKIDSSITNDTNRRYAVLLDENEKAFVNVPWTDTNIRDIQINGTSIGTKPLNIIPSEDVIIRWDNNDDNTDNDNAATISFGLSWYNMETLKYETA